MGFQLFQDDVRWDLEQNVRDEEYSERCGILGALQVQICSETIYGGIGDIGSVEEG